MNNNQTMVISVMDRDRSGIVADVTGGISDLGGNLADLRESVLCGYFTMILIADFPSEVSLEQVEKTLAKDSSLKVTVALADGSLVEQEGKEHAYVLSAVGEDRIGLVAQVSRFCSDQGVNILDLASHVEASQYTMMLLLDISNVSSLDDFKTDLAQFDESSGLNLVLQHNDIFRATNEI
jgi:glycine cleavage system transcriptional repressor